jgi:GH15 family glucan-1,4-alpha-glucosidase
MPLPIEDYALIGDTRTAALVGKNGSIDWLCLPRFDSAACFAALLGDERHGRWSIAPTRDVRRVRRRYRDGTLILDTEMETEAGTVRVTDCMPPGESIPEVDPIFSSSPAMGSGCPYISTTDVRVSRSSASCASGSYRSILWSASRHYRAKFRQPWKKPASNAG